MFTNRSPNFDKGRILKKEMLEDLRDYPRKFIDIYFKDNSDGIISGTDLIVVEDELIITKGIVKLKDKIYILENDYRLSYAPTNKETILKIIFSDEVTKGDFIISNSKITLDTNSNIEENELELCRFKLREGAQLRHEYIDFYDFSTEYNTINTINVKYSGLDKSTIDPKILRYFSELILKNKSKNNYDIAFSMQCMNQRSVNRDLILYYISNRLDLEFKEYSNLQVYKHLCEILRDIESGKSRRIGSNQNRPIKIIVD